MPSWHSVVPACPAGLQSALLGRLVFSRLCLSGWSTGWPCFSSWPSVGPACPGGLHLAYSWPIASPAGRLLAVLVQQADNGPACPVCPSWLPLARWPSVGPSFQAGFTWHCFSSLPTACYACPDVVSSSSKPAFNWPCLPSWLQFDLFVQLAYSLRCLSSCGLQFAYG